MPLDVHDHPKPIYTTKGDWSALILTPYIFDTAGEWIGWVSSEDEVYDINGSYVGWLTDEGRILRKRSANKMEKRESPEPPESVHAPATIPLPPMMRELPYGVIDVLDEEPRRLHTLGSGELKEDMN